MALHDTSPPSPQDNMWYIGPPALAWGVILGTTFKLRDDYVMSHRP